MAHYLKGRDRMRRYVLWNPLTNSCLFLCRLDSLRDMVKLIAAHDTPCMGLVYKAKVESYELSTDTYWLSINYEYVPGLLTKQLKEKMEGSA